ncbi:type II toxin-antitoxin system mRNA interferase toxin, RelE/StbE family [Patescibacteria group bacterium]|nr:type II toxin-antitoxin system mRNA interferase toxin, RelE/StbE family [Patescibacteria group bacterium]MBU1967137.1 type II toxin-antitoxin system mRNA interferase toxin, RelE/StbE family [Patescibacteria group bacterium]MBU2543045.1 type II toxin-antitoxin system mRNA interferase toxin, RelE/StbE family [Patescibacteria group bacterium]
MIIEFSPKCQKSLIKIKKKNKSLFDKLEKQLLLFQKIPNHPSLRLHKLGGVQVDSWSISIDMSYRLLFYYRPVGQEKRIVFFAVGKHEEVYK